MLLTDGSLDEECRRHEVARRDRRVFELAWSAVLVCVTLLVGVRGLGRAGSAYAYLAAVLIFAESVRRMVRRFGSAEHLMEGSELAKTAPFCAVVAVTFAWLGTGHFLLAGGALATAWSNALGTLLTVLLLAGAVIVTWLGPGPMASHAVDASVLVLGVAVALPVPASAPALAPALGTAARVVFLLLGHFVLQTRMDGRLSPARWRAMTRETSARVAAAAANIAAFRLAQLGWMFVAVPRWFVFFALARSVLNECAPPLALHRAGTPAAAHPRLDDSPPPSPRSDVEAAADAPAVPDVLQSIVAQRQSAPRASTPQDVLNRVRDAVKSQDLTF